VLAGVEEKTLLHDNENQGETMKFLMIYESSPNAPPPSPATLAKLGAYTEKMLSSGTVVLTGGLVRPSRGVKMVNEGGKISVVDGPFAESKELIDGFAVVNVNGADDAIALAKEFMEIAGEGKAEILQMFDPGGPPPQRK
jgi:hypothetical protein